MIMLELTDLAMPPPILPVTAMLIILMTWTTPRKRTAAFVEVCIDYNLTRMTSLSLLPLTYDLDFVENSGYQPAARGKLF
jgi:hypothetical protein